MKMKILSLLKKMNVHLENIIFKYEQQEQYTPFHSLSPINNADSEKDYFYALSWALENRRTKDIKNIAISGPLGSGKSSIIKTFKVWNKNKKLKFLNISLANFKEKNFEPDTEQEDGKPKNDLSRLIELSILQQIFYHEKDSNIPDSRFRKIKSFSWLNKTIKTLVALFFILTAINIFFHYELFTDIFHIGLNPESIFESNTFHYLSLGIFIFGIGLIIYNSIRIIHNLRISTLKIENTEIEINDKISKSILNHHLDEILYFFEVTDYNVVVIEDLDRFEQTEIFTKLREINLLINNSEKIKKDVVFIYATRDDMFVDKDRTKFFDFVIPIIPVINASNSNDKLIEKIKSYGFKISEDLIEDISLFIDDMRLLHNIINEYYIYHLKLDEKLDQDKLLAMIVYKNIYPNDFTELNQNKGTLYNIINGKKKYIAEEIDKIDKEIQTIRDQIEDIESLKIHDTTNLKSLYVFRYLTHLTNFRSFYIDSQQINAIDIVNNDKYFDSLMKNQIRQYYQYNNYVSNFQISFESIEKEVDPKQKYSEKKSLIEKWNKDHTEKLKQQIEAFEKEKRKVKAAVLSKLINNNNTEIKCENLIQQNLISILLRNGYIDEDYLDYISIFYEGSITKDDRQFLLNVKSQINTDFDFNLIKVDKLIQKIDVNDFEMEYVLNYKLLDHILQTIDFEEQKKNIFNLLKSESKIVLEFIEGYIDYCSNISVFIYILCKYWKNIWKYISQSDFSEEKKKKYLALILEYAAIDDIVIISKISYLSQFIANYKDLLTLISDKEKIQSVIKSLEIKFAVLEIKDSPDSLVNFIYIGNYYEINSEMISLFLKVKGNFKQVNFDTKNYYAIKNSNCKELLEYINKNIDEYISNVYLKINTNKNEDEVCFTLLLNISELSFENKEKLIDVIQTKINDITKINELEICDVLLNKSKVIANWNNLIHHFKNNENKLVESLLNFINQINNAETLSKIKIPKDTGEDKKHSDFILSLLQSEEINDNSYKFILKSIPYTYNSLDFVDLTYEKIELIIKNGILSLTKENFDNLKEISEDLHIKFLEHNKNSLIEKISEFNLDQDDVVKLLNSTIFNDNEKILLINGIEESKIIVNDNSIKMIGEIIIRNNSSDVKESLVDKAFNNKDLTIEQKIDIFNIKHNAFFQQKYSRTNNNDISNFLNSLGEPYSDITVSAKMPIIVNSKRNLSLAKTLKDINYISSFKEEEKGIRISTFRKNDNN